MKFTITCGRCQRNYSFEAPATLARTTCPACGFVHTLAHEPSAGAYAKKSLAIAALVAAEMRLKEFEAAYTAAQVRWRRALTAKQAGVMAYAPGATSETMRAALHVEREAEAAEAELAEARAARDQAREDVGELRMLAGALIQ